MSCETSGAVEGNSVADHAQMRAEAEASKARPRPENSPPDCFLNGLSVGTTAGASFPGSIVIETHVIDCELNSETKRKSRSFDLLFFLAPHGGSEAAGMVLLEKQKAEPVMRG